MASLYEKKRSPYWYLQQRDGKSGRLLNRSTGLRRDSEEETRRAKRMRAVAEAEELAVPRVQSGEEWQAWVPAWIAARYAEAGLTRIRYEAAWCALGTYFRERAVRSARVVSRADCMGYVAWRTGEEGRAAGLRGVKHNTALLELKFFSALMREAVTRGLAAVNVCLQLGIGRVPARVKPEISDEEIATIEAALDAERERPYNEAMRTAWRIAMLQCCRLRETCVPLADVSLDEGTITFRVKGGRMHTAMLHPELVPLFRLLAGSGRRTAYDMPRHFAKRWWGFFRRHGLGHLCFHSTRVTGVTRLRREGVDVRVAMEFVGHSSLLVHRIYQRSRKEDQVAAVRALSRTSASAPSCEISGERGAI